jgi:tetratricopeptide (TPR) repeat protein
MKSAQDRALRTAVAHFQAGRWAEAKALCAETLSAEPRNVMALHLLGILHCQQGDVAKGAELIGEAVRLQPDNPTVQYDLGQTRLALGRLEDAAAAFGHALALKPDFAEAHNSLGNTRKNQGRLADAAAAYGRAIEAKPDFPEAHNNLGNALKELGRPAEAVASYHKALAVTPDYAEAHFNLGLALKDLGRLAEAAASYHKALAIKPDYAEAHNNLGNALKELGKLDEAIASYNRALAGNPNYAEAQYNRGLALKDLGRVEEAAGGYRKALAIKPDYAEVHNSLGNALKDLGMLDEAVASYHKALAIKPDFAEAHNNLGNAFVHLGKLENAAASYQTALAIKPDYAEAYRHLAMVKNSSEYGNDIKDMEDVYAIPGLDDQQRMHLAFGLGKSFEDLHQYEKAFGYFLTGNAIKRGTYEYSIESAEKSFGRLKKLFVPDRFGGPQATGLADPIPIFVLGMPRSGTTLVEQILASHPKVHGAGEVDHLQKIVASSFADIEDARFAECLNRATSRDFSRAGDDYIRKIGRGADSAAFVTDKMLPNFRLIGMIKLMLPNAKIVHCCRDPLDTCLSIFKNYFSLDGLDFAYDLKELGRYYNLYRDLMDHWYSVLPDFIYNIRYEDMVADHETQSRALMAYCGLEWDEACLAFHRTNRPVYTASAAQIRRPIYAGSVGSWERYKPWLAPLLDQLADQKSTVGPD